MQRFCLGDGQWDRFGEAVQRADPESDRPKILHQFVAWFLRERGAKLPGRASSGHRLAGQYAGHQSGWPQSCPLGLNAAGQAATSPCGTAPFTRCLRTMVCGCPPPGA